MAEQTPRSFTRDEIRNMSAAEYEENRDAIMQQLEREAAERRQKGQPATAQGTTSAA